MCDGCDHEKWAEVANEALNSGALDNSDDQFLTGIVEWVEDNKHVTGPQVEKIKEKAERAGVDHG